MSALNPITDSATLALDPALEPEARLQSLLRRWLGNYFGGVSFTTRTPFGTTEQKLFQRCDFMWQEAETPNNPPYPLLHLVFSQLATERRDHAQATTGHDDRWMIEIMIKVAANLTGTAAAAQNPEFLARRVAGQVQWLLASGEREALAECGVNELKVERPPVVLAVTSWHMRMMVASCLTRREQAR